MFNVRVCFAKAEVRDIWAYGWAFEVSTHKIGLTLICDLAVDWACFILHNDMSWANYFDNCFDTSITYFMMMINEQYLHCMTWYTVDVVGQP